MIIAKTYYRNYVAFKSGFTMSDTLDKYLENRIISMIEDYEIIKRSMQQNFIAQMQQNMGFSMRCGQQNEKAVINDKKIESYQKSNNNNYSEAQLLDLSKLSF